MAEMVFRATEGWPLECAASLRYQTLRWIMSTLVNVAIKIEIAVGIPISRTTKILGTRQVLIYQAELAIRMELQPDVLM
jgi:hypothetical protein